MTKLALVVASACLAMAGRSVQATEVIGVRHDARYVPYVLVELDGIPAGEAIVDGRAGSTRWQHPGGRVTVPVLPPASNRSPWALDINGERIEVEAPEEYAHRERLPRISSIAPAVYDSVRGWRPPRSGRERATIVGIFAVVSTIFLVIGTRSRRRLLACGVTLAIVGVVLVAWRTSRAPIAVRTVEVPQTQGGDADRWWFLTHTDHPEPADLRIAWDGPTFMTAFSDEHRRAANPTLVVDPTGQPLYVRVTVAPGSTVAIVQRTDSTATTPVPAWASPLLRRVYRRRP